MDTWVVEIHIPISNDNRKDEAEVRATLLAAWGEDVRITKMERRSVQQLG